MTSDYEIEKLENDKVTVHLQCIQKLYGQYLFFEIHFKKRDQTPEKGTSSKKQKGLISLKKNSLPKRYFSNY